MKPGMKLLQRLSFQATHPSITRRSVLFILFTCDLCRRHADTKDRDTCSRNRRHKSTRFFLAPALARKAWARFVRYPADSGADYRRLFYILSQKVACSDWNDNLLYDWSLVIAYYFVFIFIFSSFHELIQSRDVRRLSVRPSVCKLFLRKSLL